MAEEPEKDLGGRPAIEIDDAICEKAESLAAQGLTLDQIARVLGIGERTLYEKKKAFPQFAQAIADGQAKGISVVVNRLYKKATGYESVEKTVTTDHEGKSKTVETTKKYEPEFQSIKHYLNNRAGWTDKSELTGPGGGPIQTKIISEIVDPKEQK